MPKKNIIHVPLNRVEGDLEIRAEVNDGQVVNAWSSGTMYRGFESILKGRGALDGLVITPRICGICNTSHLAAAADALNMIAGLTPPDDALRVIYTTLMAEHIQSDVRHGFLMFCPDFTNPANKENPLYEHFDDLLALLREHEVTLSLGDGVRPGCLADATDRNQVQELIHLGELTERAWEAGVQVIIEGPGHMPMDQITANVLLQKQMCKGAPFYVLGPLVTDIAPGYDHITGAIGGAIAAAAGADYLCYVTPAEHLKLPNIDDVHEGVIASKIAAHAADIAKGIPGALERDRQMAVLRNRLDWKGQIEMSIDPVKAARFREEGQSNKGPTCSMCGSYCAIQVFNRSQHNLEKGGT